ncbi:serine/threonine protein kinase, CMGC, CDC2/CDK subfamily [Exophiala xenobiotica]|nr:serine/threonine protein kinase, CMGC, CDC2/CDK subfamily [Exophiala xenobiotica]
MSAELQRPPKSLERLADGSLRFHGCSRITEYDYMGKLGEGTFGEVSKARSKKTGQLVALKKILMHNEKDGFPITALREIKLLKQLDHVNILKLEEMAVERPKNASKKPSMFMVTPYMDHDLSGLLENPEVNFTEAQIKCYMKQLLEGCTYLHENKILHRDMKAANLLINNRGILQIADFGLARPYHDDPPRAGHGGGEATREYTTLVVTRWYRPPELLLQLRKYTTAIDLWGVGCVFGEMFKRKPILAGNTDLNQAQIIFDLVGSPTDSTMPGWRELPGCEGVTEFEHRQPTLSRVFRELSPLGLSLLGEFLKLDWHKRINAMDALKHPYFHTDPLPARPGDLPTFEDSHELDRKKFRDQKQKPPPAPAGGSVGITSQGEWGINGRPLPPYEGRGPPGPGPRVPGGRPHDNGYGPQGHGRRPPTSGQNGGYARDHRGPPHRDMPPYDQPHRPPYDHSRGPPKPYDDGYTRRPPIEHGLPARPPAPEHDSHHYGRPDPPPYRDDGRGPPPPRHRVPAGVENGPVMDSRRPPHDRDTYVPPYSSADPEQRPPALKGRRRDDRPPFREPHHHHGPPDYGEPLRYDDAPGGIGGPDRDRGRIRDMDNMPLPPESGPYERDRRPRSRSPIRDRDRDAHRDRRDRDRDWERERDHRDRDRDHRDHRDRGYGIQDTYRR